jgi:hypothetical protein
MTLALALALALALGMDLGMDLALAISMALALAIVMAVDMDMAMALAISMALGMAMALAIVMAVDMADMADKTREAFEAAILDRNGSVERHPKDSFMEQCGQSYFSGYTELSWQLWQASRADFLTKLRSDEMVEVVATAIKTAPIVIKGQPNDSVFYGMSTAQEREAYAKAALAAIVKELTEEKL